jgi:hypothetical protein
MFSLRTWIIVAAVAVAAWWFLFRRKAQAAPAAGSPPPGETISGQPEFKRPTVPQITQEQRATQGTQYLPAKDTTSAFGLIGRAPAPAALNIGSIMAAAAGYPAGSSYSVSGNPPPPPPPPPKTDLRFTSPILSVAGVVTNAASLLGAPPPIAAPAPVARTFSWSSPFGART